jgi:hypothetical protein
MKLLPTASGNAAARRMDPKTGQKNSAKRKYDILEIIISLYAAGSIRKYDML